jgi:ABC-type transporter Mla subunit MlaD
MNIAELNKAVLNTQKKLNNNIDVFNDRIHKLDKILEDINNDTSTDTSISNLAVKINSLRESLNLLQTDVDNLKLIETNADYIVEYGTYFSSEEKTKLIKQFKISNFPGKFGLLICIHKLSKMHFKFSLLV